MDHRWDESTWQDRAARGERERFGTSRIARDPDVERRDRMCLEDRLRSINQSPWAIGEAWHDQRDLYTRNSSIDSDGYGCGPNVHPEEGSYAYHRDSQPAVTTMHASHASIYEREAWPWLNYKEPQDDPYFAHLQPHERPHREENAHRDGLWTRVWTRLTKLVAKTLHVGQSGVSSAKSERSDTRLELDVEMALAGRRDIDTTDIRVNVKGGDVTLEGTVTDRRSKHVAEEIVEGVRGVHDVHNRLKIRRDDPTDANVAFVFPLALMGAG